VSFKSTKVISNLISTVYTINTAYGILLMVILHCFRDDFA